MANMKTIKEPLMNAIFEVFERVFFVFAEPVTKAEADFRMRANISFSGSIKGDMQISLSEDLAKVMAQNMLSIDDDELTDSVVADCVKECLNMVCGSFVRKVDPDHVFNLTIPSLAMITGPPSYMDAQSDSSLRLAFDAEGGSFEVLTTATGCV